MKGLKEPFFCRKSMRLTKIYTKTGDQGNTMLASGEFVSKGSLRIEAYGTVDELNSFVGLTRDKLISLVGHEKNKLSPLVDKLLDIQHSLFDLGGELATPQKFLDTGRQQVVTDEDVKQLEILIDAMNSQLEPLANFVLPGGSEINSLAHVCRTIARRAERHIVNLANEEVIRDRAIIFINRLSDYFFVFARFVSFHFETQEVLWNQKNKTNPISNDKKI